MTARPKDQGLITPIAGEVHGVQMVQHGQYASHEVAAFNLSTWVTAILGAVGLFLLFGAVRGRSRRSRRARSWLGPRS